MSTTNKFQKLTLQKEEERKKNNPVISKDKERIRIKNWYIIYLEQKVPMICGDIKQYDIETDEDTKIHLFKHIPFKNIIFTSSDIGFQVVDYDENKWSCLYKLQDFYFKKKQNKTYLEQIKFLDFSKKDIESMLKFYLIGLERVEKERVIETD
jgi:hypothetical protein